MRIAPRALMLTLLTGIVAVATAARPSAPARGGVIQVRIAVVSQADAAVDVQASVANGMFTDGRNSRTRTLRGDGERTIVAELTHTGRVTLVSEAGPVRAVVTYASAPPGVQVSEAQWRRLNVAHSGSRITFERVGSFVAVAGSASPRARVGSR